MRGLTDGISAPNPLSARQSAVTGSLVLRCRGRKDDFLDLNAELVIWKMADFFILGFHLRAPLHGWTKGEPHVKTEPWLSEEL